jgi:hypothetical protein
MRSSTDGKMQALHVGPWKRCQPVVRSSIRTHSLWPSLRPGRQIEMPTEKRPFLPRCGPAQLIWSVADTASGLRLRARARSSSSSWVLTCSASLQASTATEYLSLQRRQEATVATLLAHWRLERWWIGEEEGACAWVRRCGACMWWLAQRPSSRPAFYCAFLSSRSDKASIPVAIYLLVETAGRTSAWLPASYLQYTASSFVLLARWTLRPGQRVHGGVVGHLSGSLSLSILFVCRRS